MDTLNIYQIYEQYRDEWDSGIIQSLYQESAHLSEAAIQFSCNAEFFRMQTEGSATVHRIAHRYQDIGDDEVTFGERRIFPVGFFSTQVLSSRDFILQGSLGVTLANVHQRISEAAKCIPDQVFLGVEPSEDYGGNCLIQPDTDKSYYYGQDGSSTHQGTYQGLLGGNYTGIPGSSEVIEHIEQQPWFVDASGASAAAAAYSSYASDLSGLDPRNTTVIPVNYVDRTGSATPADSGLTLAKLKYIVFCLRLRHIDPTRKEVWMAITPAQLDDLMGIEEFKNSLYGGQALTKGIPPVFMGIHFLITVDCPIVNVGTQADQHWVRVCPVWCKDAAAFGVWENPITQIDRQPTKIDKYTVTVVFSYGAGRRYKKGVLCVHCDEFELHGFNTESPVDLGGGGSGSGGSQGA